MLGILPERKRILFRGNRVDIDKDRAKDLLPRLSGCKFHTNVLSSVVGANEHLWVRNWSEGIFTNSWWVCFVLGGNGNGLEGGLTERVMGPAWEVRSCLTGPATRNSSLGVIIQNPTGGSLQIQPWTWLSLSSIEYWYLSSTCTHSGSYQWLV